MARKKARFEEALRALSKPVTKPTINKTMTPFKITQMADQMSSKASDLRVELANAEGYVADLRAAAKSTRADVCKEFEVLIAKYAGILREHPVMAVKEHCVARIQSVTADIQNSKASAKQLASLEIELCHFLGQDLRTTRVVNDAYDAVHLTTSPLAEAQSCDGQISNFEQELSLVSRSYSHEVDDEDAQLSSEARLDSSASSLALAERSLVHIAGSAAAPLTQERINWAKEVTTRLGGKKARNVEEVQQANKVLSQAQQRASNEHDLQATQAAIKWATDILASAKYRKVQLREAYHILTLAKEQVRPIINKPLTRKQRKARNAQLKACTYKQGVPGKKPKTAILKRKEESRHKIMTRSNELARAIQREQQIRPLSQPSATGSSTPARTALPLRPAEKKISHDRYDFNQDLFDPVWGPMIEASERQSVVCMATRHNSGLPRKPSEDFAGDRGLSTGRLPMMSGAVPAAFVDQPNSDDIHMLDVETHFHRLSVNGYESAAEVGTSVYEPTHFDTRSASNRFTGTRVDYLEDEEVLVNYRPGTSGLPAITNNILWDVD